MAADESVTHWIDALHAGDQTAAQRLWEHYFHRLINLARQKLTGMPKRAADEEDIVLSAFASFCRGVEHGRFPQLDDRSNLWRLLMVITARKAHHFVRDENREKRGGGTTQAIDSRDGPDGQLVEILSREPTPEFSAQMTDEYERLLARLDDEELVQIAVWKMEGYQNAEIAQKLGCVERTIERRLRVIRSIWSEERDG